MSKEIKLSSGKVAVVDDDDYEWLNQWKWSASHRGNDRWYATRRSGLKIIYMHRVILNPCDRVPIDHKDGNGLNNTRDNIRICTSLDNSRNSKISSSNTTGYKGVCWRKDINRYQVSIKSSSRRIHLGYFDDIEDAARAYDKEAIILFGDFAKTNF